MLDVRFFHQLEKLARIGTQAFHITPLTLGVDRVECQRGLPGTAESGHDDQLVAGELDVDALEIVFPRTANPDALLHAEPVSSHVFLRTGSVT